MAWALGTAPSGSGGLCETQLLWTSGGAADKFVVVDLATGDRQNLMQMSSAGPVYPGGHDVHGPLRSGVWSTGTFYWDPDNRDHVFMMVGSNDLVKFELHTSNSYTFSL